MAIHTLRGKLSLLSLCVLPLACSTATRVAVSPPSSSIPTTATTAPEPTVTVSTTEPTYPLLTDGAALADVMSVNRDTQTAVFEVTCGRTFDGNRIVPPGRWRVDLRRASFEEDSNPQNVAAGHVFPVSFSEWAQTATAMAHWVLYVRPSGTTIGNGPTYDVCANANGG